MCACVCECVSVCVCVCTCTSVRGEGFQSRLASVCTIQVHVHVSIYSLHPHTYTLHSSDNCFVLSELFFFPIQVAHPPIASVVMLTLLLSEPFPRRRLDAYT